MLEVVRGLSGPKDDSDDVVNYISVDNESKAKEEEGVDGLVGIVRCNISVADGGDGVDPPVD